MDKNKLQALLQTIDEAGQVKLKVLHNAVIDGLEAYRKKPIQANLKNWQAAEKALDQYLDEIQVRQDPEPAMLPNISAVVAFLKAKGWTAPSSTIYLHHQKGKLPTRNDGTFDHREILAYASANLSRLGGRGEAGSLDSGEIVEIESLQRQKLIADAKKAAAQADHWDLKTRIQTGEYIPRAEFERALAARAMVLKNDLQTFFRSLAAEIIQIVDGDAAKTPDLIDFAIEKLEVYLGRYAVKGQEFSAKIELPMEDENATVETSPA